MERFKLYLAVVAAGITGIFLINASPLSRLGIGIEIPFGWENAQVELYHDCTLEDGKDPNSNFCAGSCLDPPHNSEGIPFFTSRQNKTDKCYRDNNSAAMLLNYALGALIGVAAVYGLDKSEKTKVD